MTFCTVNIGLAPSKPELVSAVFLHWIDDETGKHIYAKVRVAGDPNPMTVHATRIKSMG